MTVNPMTDLGQLLHTLLHDISPWDKDGWKVERKPSGKWSAFFRIAAVDNSAVVSMVCRKSGASDACFIAASPATVARLVKGIVDERATIHSLRDHRNFGRMATVKAVRDFGIPASDWKLLLERLGEG